RADDTHGRPETIADSPDGVGTECRRGGAGRRLGAAAGRSRLVRSDVGCRGQRTGADAGAARAPVRPVLLRPAGRPRPRARVACRLAAGPPSRRRCRLRHPAPGADAIPVAGAPGKARSLEPGVRSQGPGVGVQQSRVVLVVTPGPWLLEAV